MAAKRSEGVGATGLDVLRDKKGGRRFTRDDPLWPAGHLPHEGEITLTTACLTSRHPIASTPGRALEDP